MLIKNSDQNKFTLDNFEGPLTFLLYLVQKSEINISEVSLKEIIDQYMERMQALEDQNVDEGAEFISTTAVLLWLKSKMLLPVHEQAGQIEIEPEESPFGILPQLIEYLQFKQISKELAERERRQMDYFVRGHAFSETSFKKPLGIEHISLEDLVGIFQEALQKSTSQLGLIHEEVWRVADKITSIRSLLRENLQVTLRHLFSPECCREELIVIFLAILELMKLGHAGIVKEGSSGEISINWRKESEVR